MLFSSPIALLLQ